MKIKKEKSDLVESLNEAVLHSRGELELEVSVRKRVRFKEADSFDSKRVKKIRQILNLSQSSLADLLGTSVKTVQAWEGADKGKKPKGPSARFLSMLEENPDYMKHLIVS